MAQTVTLLLLFAAEPTRGERALLDRYESEQQVQLVAPAPTPPSVFPPYEREQALAIEGRLDEARTFASSLDEKRALELLAAIERDLLQHPELPQAAWLMAERHRLAASVRRAQADGARDAEELSARARVLEGARAAAFGEAETEVPAPAAAVEVRFSELGPRDVLELDGVKSGSRTSLVPGDHQVRVLRNAEVVWAGWSRLGATPEARLGIRPVLACSVEDLSGLEGRGASPIAPAGVACPRYVVARRAGQTLEVAACRGQACGPFVPLVAPRSEPRRFPVWATIAIAGAATVGVTSLVLWGAGAFDRDEPAPRTDFIYRGLGP
jgi:hypothetical protein